MQGIHSPGPVHSLTTMFSVNGWSNKSHLHRFLRTLLGSIYKGRGPASVWVVPPHKLSPEAEEKGATQRAEAEAAEPTPFPFVF